MKYALILSVCMVFSGGLALADDTLVLEQVAQSVGEGAISPDGRLVLVVRDNTTLSLIDLSSGKEKQILKTSWLFHPRMNPAGTRIVFFGNPAPGRSAINDLWVVNADGSGLKPLLPQSPADVEDRHPIWSSDGTHIAWSRSGVVWVVRADGTGARAITPKTGNSYAYPLDWLDENILLAQESGAASTYTIFSLNVNEDTMVSTGLVRAKALFDKNIHTLIYFDGKLRSWDITRKNHNDKFLTLEPQLNSTLSMTRSADMTAILFDAVDDMSSWINHLYLLDVRE
jgi:Tol biopolymer transport system component